MTNIPEVTTADLLSFQDTNLLDDVLPHVHGNNQMNSPREDKSNLLKTEINIEDDVEQPENTEKSFWSLDYYQQFFDVNTKDVIDRIVASFVPKYESSSRKTKPDLYGPVWICITLIVTIAIGANIAMYFIFGNAKYHWKYNFHVISYAATAVCSYVTIIPLILWVLLKSHVSNADTLSSGSSPVPGFLELICMYGYSLFIFIPVSMFWIIQVYVLQWSLVLVAAILSVSPLLIRLVPAFRLSRFSIVYILSVILAHFLLSSGFMLYFHHAPLTTIQRNGTNHTFTMTM